MSSTQTRIRKDNDKDGDDDANVMAFIDPIIFASLVTALTGAITTTASNTTATRPVSVKAKKYSSAIYPYDSKLMDTSTKEGKYQFYIATNPEHGWSLIGVTVEKADKLMDLSKDRTVQFNLDRIMKIPTA